jgi:hypothetical protein
MPILLVLEDRHRLDLLSRALLGVIGRTIVNMPVMSVPAYRLLS